MKRAIAETLGRKFGLSVKAVERVEDLDDPGLTEAVRAAKQTHEDR